MVDANSGKNVLQTCSKIQVPCRKTFWEYCNQLFVSFATKFSAVSSYTVVCDSASIDNVKAFMVLSRCADRSFNNSSYLSCRPSSNIGQYFITLNKSRRKIALAKSMGISFPSTSVKTFLNDAIASFSAFVCIGLPVRFVFRIASSRSRLVDDGCVGVEGFGIMLVGEGRGNLLIASWRLLVSSDRSFCSSADTFAASACARFATPFLNCAIAPDTCFNDSSNLPCRADVSALLRSVISLICRVSAVWLSMASTCC